jgi:hypothetical protein
VWVDSADVSAQEGGAAEHSAGAVIYWLPSARR